MTVPESVCSCFNVRRAARHVSQAYDRHLAPSGLRTTQYSVLYHLDAAGPLSQLALARLLGVDRTTLGRNLRPLQRDGLLSIAINPDDRRGRALAVTDKGLRALDSARPLWRAAQDSFASAYGADRIAALHETLASVAALELG